MIRTLVLLAAVAVCLTAIGCGTPDDEPLQAGKPDPNMSVAGGNDGTPLVKPETAGVN